MRAALAMLAAIPLFALQEGKKDPRTEFEERMKKLKFELAEQRSKIAEFLDTARQHKWARQEDEKVIELNPDHEKARARLGYKYDGGWQKDPSAKVERENKKKEGSAEEKRVREQWEERKKKIAEKFCGEYVELGDFAAKNKLAMEAELAYQLALELNPDNEKARKGLKHEKKGDSWVTPRDKELRDEFRKGIEKMPKGEEDSEPTEYEKGLNQKHEHRKSPRAFVESPHLDQTKLQRHIQLCEQTQEMFYKIFEMDPIPPGRIHLIILKEKGEHEAYIDKFYTSITDENLKNRYKEQAGVWHPKDGRCELYQSNRPDVAAFDWNIHYSCHVLTYFLFGEDHSGGRRPWLHEGIAYYFTSEMQDTCQTTCVRFGSTKAADDKKDPADPRNWPSIVRKWVRGEGKEPPINAVIKANLNDLDEYRTIKAWSLVDFLLKDQRPKFLEMIGKMRGDHNDTGEKALKVVFNWTTDDFDEAWRTWAKRKY